MIASQSQSTTPKNDDQGSGSKVAKNLPNLAAIRSSSMSKLQTTKRTLLQLQCEKKKQKPSKTLNAYTEEVFKASQQSKNRNFVMKKPPGDDSDSAKSLDLNADANDTLEGEEEESEDTDDREDHMQEDELYDELYASDTDEKPELELAQDFLRIQSQFKFNYRL